MTRPITRSLLSRAESHVYESMEGWLGELHAEVMMAVYDDYRRQLPQSPPRGVAESFLLDMMEDVNNRIQEFFIKKMAPMLARAHVFVDVDFRDGTITLVVGNNRDYSVFTVSYDDREGVIGLTTEGGTTVRHIGSERTFSYVNFLVARYGFSMAELLA